MHLAQKSACRVWLSASARATSLRGLARLGGVWDDSQFHDLWTTRDMMTARCICCCGLCCGGRRPAQPRLVCSSLRCRCRYRCRGGGG